ncbi:hypothetical protein [Maricaulis sp.]|uniref:hypothetical protein n=1 Tax=Maricaulis sp. TaxID=1486257 RepID=UPI002607B623|nr:hypothetical protein [Maricaulis sp.]
MTVTATYNAEKGWFEHRVSGLMLAAEVGAAIVKMLTSQHWGDGKARLILVDPATDMSEFTLDAIRDDILSVLASHTDKLTGRHKAAMVTTGFGHDIITQLYELVPENKSAFVYRHFTTEDEAVAWLES